MSSTESRFHAPMKRRLFMQHIDTKVETDRAPRDI